MGEEFLRHVHLDDLALVHEHHAVGDLAGKTHLMGDHQHGHAVLGEADHGVEHLLDHFRIERGGRLVEQHDLRVHAERARDRDPLLLAAGQLAGIFVGLLRDLDPLEVMQRDLLGFLLRHLAHPDRRQRAVFQHGEMRKQVEMLEHHADVAAHLVDLLEVVGQLDAVDDDAALLMLLEPVDAADHGRFAGAGRPADDDALAAHHLEIDVAQHVEIAEPLVHADDFHRHGGSELRRLHVERGIVDHRNTSSVCRRCGEPGFHRAAHSATCRSRRSDRRSRRPHSRSCWSPASPISDRCARPRSCAENRKSRR